MFDAIYTALFFYVSYILLMEVCVPGTVRFAIDMWRKKRLMSVLGICVQVLAFWAIPVIALTFTLLGMVYFICLRLYGGREFVDNIQQVRQFYFD